jgi:uncharacterized protein YbaP (TraB family)
MITNLRNQFRFTFAFALLLVLPVAAQTPRAATTTHHSLWKVEGKRNTVYLMGSIHVLKAENYPLPAALDGAYTNSQVVVFETDIDEMEKPEAQMKLLAKAQLPEGKTLADEISPELYEQFTKHLQSAGLSPVMFSTFKPSMAALTLVVLELNKNGLDPKYGLDKHFHGLAKTAGKKVIGLETVDFQIGLVTDFTKEESEALLRSTLTEMEKLKEEIGIMLKAWQTGDSLNLEKLLNESVEKEPALFKRLLTNRNESWVPKIEEFCKGEQNVVVIVGAAHLIGKQGVVELLKKKGLKVTQL